MTPYIGSHFLCRFCILDVNLLTLEICGSVLTALFYVDYELDKDLFNFIEMDRIYG